MEFLIYLDVCCLNRPFDDQTQERIFLEAEAIRLILARCQSGEWQVLTISNGIPATPTTPLAIPLPIDQSVNSYIA